MKKDITDIFVKTPRDKQVMMFSATFSKDVQKIAHKFMQNVNTIYFSKNNEFIISLRKLSLMTVLSFS